VTRDKERRAKRIREKDDKVVVYLHSKRIFGQSIRESIENTRYKIKLKALCHQQTIRKCMPGTGGSGL
jgi:hypothetical protein